MNRLSLILASSILSLSVAACDQKDVQSTPQSDQTSQAKPAAAVVDVQDEALVLFLDAQWEARTALSAEYQAYLGRKTNMDQWDDQSLEALDANRAMRERQLADIKSTFDRDYLSREGQLNYDLAIYSLENWLNLDNFRIQRFALSQFTGIHSSIPVFLANYHRIESVQDAKDYIARVRSASTRLSQAVTQLEVSAAAGYPLPAFSYPLIEQSALNVIKGAPISDGKNISVFNDFEKKVNKLDVSEEEKAALFAELTDALKGPFAEGYTDFANRVAAISSSTNVDGDQGVGTRENGEAFYNALLASYTTTDLTADEIHQMGLNEVARIHAEMQDIMATVEFEGSLQDFFEFMRTDEQFYFDNTDEGREAYLELARTYNEGMVARIDELFITKPKAPVEVRRVEPFRERAAGKAFYTQPAADGSRPGIFYANLYDMADMPIYQLEALVYHEAIPGHHMQRTIQIEMEGLPKFRQFGGYTAYTEGWGLYCELLPKEIGLYEDPYSDFGRLAMELWRAARLVVDTGLHAKGWSMDQAIGYLQENTPNPEGDTVKAIERYIVLPGQATSYKIGMIKILELRENAKEKLGDKFNIAEFHDVILTGGPLPLSVLEKQIDAYIEEKLAE